MVPNFFESVSFIHQFAYWNFFEDLAGVEYKDNSFDPPDLLKPEEVRAYEQTLYRTQIYRKRSLAGQRKRLFPFISRHRYPYSSSPSPSALLTSSSSSSPSWRIRSFRNRRATTRKPRLSRRRTMLNSPDSTTSIQNDSNIISDSASSKAFAPVQETSLETSLFDSKPSVDDEPASNYSSNSNLTEISNQTIAVITVHDIAIRPSVLVLKQGSITARLRYIIQLHKELKEQYKLILEARINPEYPPLYIGVIQNICSHWPANIPSSKCSTRKPRFYQKDTICFCHMPPGVYRQRLRINLNNVLDGLELPRFLVNVLFQGKKLNIYITVKLESENKNIVGCAEIKLPLEFVSA